MEAQKTLLLAFAAFAAFSLATGRPGSEQENQIIGGISDIDFKDGPRRGDIENITRFALDECNKKLDSEYLHRLIKIKEAKSQVVAGELFFIKFFTGQTVCKKTENKVLDDCPLAEGSDNEDYKLCEAEVWEQQWIGFRNVTKVACEKVTQQQVNS